jgi:hypothetical protein
MKTKIHATNDCMLMLVFYAHGQPNIKLLIPGLRAPVYSPSFLSSDALTFTQFFTFSFLNREEVEEDERGPSERGVHVC